MRSKKRESYYIMSKCNHCNEDRNLKDGKLCKDCRRELKRNPNHVPRHKKHENFVCECGSRKFYCKNMCQLCYNRSPIRNTPERKAKDKVRQELKKEEYNENRGLKRNPNYKKRPDTSNFVCKCGSTKYGSKGYCKSCAHKKLGYGKKYERTHRKERKIANLANPEWQQHANENYSKKFMEALQMTHLEIISKWRKSRKDCLIRDNCTCQICGDTKWLQVHHIIHKSKQPLLFFNINNLTTLCTKCHNDVHGKKLDEKKNINFLQGIKAIQDKNNLAFLEKFFEINSKSKIMKI